MKGPEQQETPPARAGDGVSRSLGVPLREHPLVGGLIPKSSDRLKRTFGHEWSQPNGMRSHRSGVGRLQYLHRSPAKETRSGWVQVAAQEEVLVKRRPLKATVRGPTYPFEDLFEPEDRRLALLPADVVHSPTVTESVA